MGRDEMDGWGRMWEGRKIEEKVVKAEGGIDGIK